MKWLVVVAACGGGGSDPVSVPSGSAVSGGNDAAPAPPRRPAPHWLRGDTHVHAKPSGDSTTPIPRVLEWYESHGYDFISITDHNQVSEIDTAIDTTGKPYLRDPAKGLIVLSGIELTQNATGCVPAGDASGRCRVHVNLIGSTARPRAKLKSWFATDQHERSAKFRVALEQMPKLGGIAQINHPQWYWGMTPDILIDAAKHGAVLYEVANIAFRTWNAGDNGAKGQDAHPSTEALWDAVLSKGVTLWGVASDDAHHYDGGGKYPAGGAWVMVDAPRDPQAIVDALAAGRFYASTGVALDRAGVEGDELVVEIAADDAADAITWIENGVRTVVPGKRGRRALPATGYVRAEVERRAAKAWIQPARRL